MKPDLLLSADEPCGPPNPGMSCAAAPVSEKDLDMDSVHELSAPSSPLLLPSRKLQGKKENTAVAGSQSAESNL